MGATAINYTSLAFPLSLSKCHPLCAPTQVEHFLAVAEAGPFCGFLLPRTICPAAVTSDAERGHNVGMRVRRRDNAHAPCNCDAETSMVARDTAMPSLHC
jgi:hypothetical protein